MTAFDSYASGIAGNATASSSQLGKLHPNAPLMNSPADRKLRKAAGEFESLLLSSLWMSMKSSFAASDEDSTDPAHDTLENWGIDAMAGAVGNAGGLGLGKLILKHLEPMIGQSQAGKDANPGKVSSTPADTSYREVTEHQASLKFSKIWPIGIEIARAPVAQADGLIRPGVSL